MSARASYTQRSPISDQSWRRRARCRIFYGLPWTADEEPAPEDLAMMAGVCAGCPVQSECGRDLLAHEEQGGFWAGVWVPWYNYESGVRRVRWERARARLRGRVTVTSPLSESPQV